MIKYLPFIGLGLLLSVCSTVISCSNDDDETARTDTLIRVDTIYKEIEKDYGVSVSGYIYGNAYVDLGLSVKWATCNVGAARPEEYGEYISWGETYGKEYYDWSNYKYADDYDKQTKYCTNPERGNVDGLSRLEKEDDAARVNMGEKWRIPTKTEYEELIANCDWTFYYKLNGSIGILGKSKKNGNTIFFPNAGHYPCPTWSIIGQSGEGHYWTSDLTPVSVCAYTFYFIDYIDETFSNGDTKGSGNSIRPVSEY